MGEENSIIKKDIVERYRVLIADGVSPDVAKRHILSQIEIILDMYCLGYEKV